VIKAIVAGASAEGCSGSLRFLYRLYALHQQVEVDGVLVEGDQHVLRDGVDLGPVHALDLAQRRGDRLGQVPVLVPGSGQTLDFDVCPAVAGPGPALAAVQADVGQPGHRVRHPARDPADPGQLAGLGRRALNQWRAQRTDQRSGGPGQVPGGPQRGRGRDPYRVRRYPIEVSQQRDATCLPFTQPRRSSQYTRTLPGHVHLSKQMKSSYGICFDEKLPNIR